jgi:hypothetical protein
MADRTSWIVCRPDDVDMGRDRGRQRAERPSMTKPGYIESVRSPNWLCMPMNLSCLVLEAHVDFGAEAACGRLRRREKAHQDHVTRAEPCLSGPLRLLPTGCERWS